LRALLTGIDDSITLSWTELDELVGGLPPSAGKHREFWAGDRSGWPGFRTKDVQLGQRVTFERVLAPTSLGAAGKARKSGRVPELGPDDELILRAAAATGIADRDVLVREGLETLIRLAAARKLAGLGGTDPSATAAPRRRDGAA
jgi:hypothetical protein